MRKAVLIALLALFLAMPAFAEPAPGFPEEDRLQIGVGFGLISPYQISLVGENIETEFGFRIDFPSMVVMLLTDSAFIPMTAGLECNAYCNVVDNTRNTFGIGLTSDFDWLIGDGAVFFGTGLGFKYTHFFNGHDGIYFRTSFSLFGRSFEDWMNIFKNPVYSLQDTFWRETRIGYCFRY